MFPVSCCLPRNKVDKQLREGTGSQPRVQVQGWLVAAKATGQRDRAWPKAFQLTYLPAPHHFSQWGGGSL